MSSEENGKAPEEQRAKPALRDPMSADTAQPRDPVTKDELAEDAARGSGHKNENANDDGEKYKVENANDDGEKEKKRVRKRGGGLQARVTTRYTIYSRKYWSAWIS